MPATVIEFGSVDTKSSFCMTSATHGIDYTLLNRSLPGVREADQNTMKWLREHYRPTMSAWNRSLDVALQGGTILYDREALEVDRGWLTGPLSRIPASTSDCGSSAKGSSVRLMFA